MSELEQAEADEIREFSMQMDVDPGGKLDGVGFCLMVATTLHSIAVGNLLPAWVKVACVDISPATVTKSGVSQVQFQPRFAKATADSLAFATTLPMVPSANVAGDPVAIINAILKIMATSVQLTADMGRKFLTKLGILSPAAAAADPGITNGRIPSLNGRQASEFVIRRAMSQLGVPYSWGGGNANGPSRGIDQGANTVGFDCSGLMLYAFAGVGIKLDHYSGSQYNAGRKVPSSQMRRGDLIFYGPNASQHESMYLGDGMMLEAPYTGSVVKISPVRTSGMTPYVTRLIEY